MSNLTQYAQKKLLDHTLSLASWSMPTVYMALFRADPGEEGSLTSEVIGTNYLRVELTTKMGATTLATGISTNSSAVTFPTPGSSPNSPWGVVTHAAIMDAATAGNMLMWLPLTLPIIVGTATPAPSFAIGIISLAAVFDAESQLTKYLAKKWLDHLLGKSAFTMPTANYLAMFSADPTSDGTLTNEIATGAYARVEVTSVMSLTELETGQAANDDTITFPDPTGAYSVTHFALLDAATAGNMLMFEARTSTLQISAGSLAPELQAGQLVLRAD